jgi:hypothetical protein
VTRAAGEAAQQAAEVEAGNIAAAEQAGETAAAARRAAATASEETPVPSSAPLLQPLVLTPSEPNSRF